MPQLFLPIKHRRGVLPCRHGIMQSRLDLRQPGARSCSAAPLPARPVRPQRRVVARTQAPAARAAPVAQAAQHQQQQKPASTSTTALAPGGPGAGRKYCPFKPDFYSSEPVQLSGSWDGWALNLTLPINPQTGDSGIVLELDAEQGDLTYKYNVAGKWHLSNSDAAASDAQGCVNNTTSGRQLVRFTFPAACVGRASRPDQTVHLIGSFTGWQVLIPMTLASDAAYHCDVALPPGHHTFRFLLNAQLADTPGLVQVGGLAGPTYAVLQHLPQESLPSGVAVNSLRVPPPPVFKLLYHTPFSEAYITYAFRGEAAPPRRARLHHVTGAPGLMSVQLPAPSRDAVLEFSLSGCSWSDGSSLGTMQTGDDDAGWGGGRLQRDPEGSGSYSAAGTGTWRLRGGSLALDEPSLLPPLMLCTDLDGTLIEDAAEDSEWLRANDAATRAAGEYWGKHCAPAGGLLVFNTGRSIGMVEGLLAKKAGIMPWPAAIITAVGTKVFLYDVATRSWAVDPAYSHLLDEGWNMNEVRSAAQALLGRYHDAVRVTDDGREHPHRLSLQIRSDVLDEAMGRWSAALSDAGVQHQMVASIGGEWRYVDCISAQAGKGRAMAYLASKFQIALEDVVAAGDSGNDLLMLGRLPGLSGGGFHPAIVMANSHPEVWDWLSSCTPEERSWVYTPKAERAAGLVEGIKAILADKLAARAAKAKAKPRRRLGTSGGGSSSGSSSGNGRPQLAAAPASPAPAVRALRA